MNGQRITFCGKILSYQNTVAQVVELLGDENTAAHLRYLSHEEFKNEYLGLKTDIERGDDERYYQEFAYKDVDVEDLPKSVDWRKKGTKALAGVFDGRCGVNLDHGIAAVVYGSSKGSDHGEIFLEQHGERKVASGQRGTIIN
ncbi:hypothetical protein Bca52824_017203 [Brassica carinata]|uniref:Uncharacterized protein n=1 Tax=Brassica carinata TaxID=52824 RepID=A0A8X7VMM8_BRACI|nr:hypothetical protein Bca52824_017203 [Brassica carinata]